MYPEKKEGHKMARPQQNWGLLTLLTRWASIWTMPNTASPKSEPPCGRAVYTPVRANKWNNKIIKKKHTKKTHNDWVHQLDEFMIKLIKIYFMKSIIHLMDFNIEMKSTTILQIWIVFKELK